MNDKTVKSVKNNIKVYNFNLTDTVCYSKTGDVLVMNAIASSRKENKPFQQKTEEMFQTILGKLHVFVMKHNLNMEYMHDHLKLNVIDHKDYEGDGNKNGKSNVYYRMDKSFVEEHSDYLKNLENTVFKPTRIERQAESLYYKKDPTKIIYFESIIANTMSDKTKEKSYFLPILSDKKRPEMDYMRDMTITQMHSAPEVLKLTGSLRYKGDGVDFNVYLLIAKDGTDKALITQSQDYVKSVLAGK